MAAEDTLLRGSNIRGLSGAVSSRDHDRDHDSNHVTTAVLGLGDMAERLLLLLARQVATCDTPAARWHVPTFS